MRLLVVEDDPHLGDGLCAGLRQQGFVVDWVQDGITASAALETETYAAVVLDIALPGRNGLEVLRQARARRDSTPVLLLTARDSIDDRIHGLDAGADDYLIKPFDLGELAARVRALVRRASGIASAEIRVGPLVLNPSTREVRYRDQPCLLSAREYSLLETFMTHAGRILTREQLASALYAWGDEIESNAIEVHLHHLRRKIAPHIVQTLRGVGYLMPRDLE